MAYYATLHCLQTMAESTQRLNDTVKEKHPDIPWREIRGFRNVLVHDYLGDTNDEQVWKTVIDDLPTLKVAMTAECPGWKTLKTKR